MRVTTIMLAAFLMAATASAIDSETALDSSTAFFEGESHNYVIPAPRNFRMVTEPANADGYSLAFIPKQDDYEAASMTIAVSLLKLNDNQVRDVIEADTTAARKHFGVSLVCSQVDSLPTFNRGNLVSYFFEDKTRFLPLVMMAYFDGGAEVVIFELSIAENGVPRFMATDVFGACVGLFRALRKGTPTQ